MTGREQLEEWAEIADENPGQLVEAIPEIGAQTDQEDATDRNQAVTALSRIAKQYPEAVADVRPVLVDRLSDENEVVRYNAALALQRIGRVHPDRLIGALQPVAERLGDEDRDVQNQCGDVLSAVTDEYPEEVSTVVSDALNDIVSDLFAEDSDVRSTAAIGFLTAASTAYEAVVPHLDALIDRFEDEALGPRYHATMAVKRVATRDPTATTEAVDSLAGQLSDDDDDIRDLAIHALAAIAESEPDAVAPALDSIGDALRDDHGDVRIYASQATTSLVETHPLSVKSHTDALVEALARGPEDATDSAAEVLHVLAEDHPDTVRTALRDADVDADGDTHSAIEAVRNNDATVSAFSPDDNGTSAIKSPHDSFDSVVDRVSEVLSGNTVAEGSTGSPEYKEEDAVEINAGASGCAYSRRLTDHTWECPHEPADESDFCLFHMPVAEKDEQLVKEALMEAVTSDGNRVKELIGARFGDIDLSHEILGAADNHPIDIRYGHVAGDLTGENISIQQPLEADRLTVTGTADFRTATFEMQTTFDAASLGVAMFNDAIFERKVSFDDAHFTAEASFDRVRFEAATSFERAVFSDTVDMRQVSAEKILDMDGARFSSGVDLLQFSGNVLRFIDATVNGVLNLKSAQLTDVIRISELDISSNFDLTMASVGGIHGEDVNCEGDLEMLSISIRNQLMLKECNIQKNVNINQSEMSQLVINNCTIGGDLNLGKTNSHDTVAVRQSDIGGTMKIYALHSEGKLHLINTTIRGELDGMTVKLVGTAIFKNVSIGGKVDLRRCNFEQRVSILATEFESTTSFENTSFKSDTKFEGVNFKGKTTFENAAFDESLLLDETTFEGSIDFTDVSITSAEFEGTEMTGERPVNFTRAEIADGTIWLGDDRTVYNFTNAVIGDIELGFYTDSDSSLLEHFRFHNTTFDGFNFGSHRDELSEAGWQIHTTLDEFQFSSGNVDEVVEMLDQSDLDDVDEAEVASLLDVDEEFVEQLLISDDLKKDWFEKGAGGLTFTELENTYQKAKQGANDQGLNDIAAEFFIHEKRFKRHHHSQRIRAADSVFDRAYAGFNWLANLTMDATTGYGEHPRNVVFSSLSTVGLFTGIYWYLDSLSTESGLWEYLLFSFQGFIQFIIGTSPQGGVATRLATAIEGFIGAFFIALFVFTLTRSLNR